MAKGCIGEHCVVCNGLGQNAFGFGVHVNVQVGPSVQLGSVDVIVLVSFDVSARDGNGELFELGFDGPNHVIRRSIHSRGVVHKDGLSGFIPIQSYLDCSLGDSTSGAQDFQCD